MHVSPFPSQVLPFDNVVQINYVEEEHTEAMHTSIIKVDHSALCLP